MPIQVLPKHISDLIAAGEVVERPASVVKELCENAMDAGAAAVTVEIQGGGVRYIRVTDNGHGIPRNEVPTAFLPHATSKITGADDLEHIVTLGFRGEALASIAAVARAAILTKTSDESIGTSFEISGGAPGELTDAGCPNGTTLIVRDLFFHTPARMKFLKKDVTEGNYVGAAMERLALSRPDVAFTYIRDGKTVFQSPGDKNPASNLRAVLGKQFYAQLLGVKIMHNGIEIKGFISSINSPRPNRSGQYFFLNGRWIKCPTASAALSEAYKHSLPAGKFPACVLYIALPAGLVDVNVHPAKTEVRFADDRPVFSAIYQAASEALSQGIRQQKLGIRGQDSGIRGQGLGIRGQDSGVRKAEIPARRVDFWQHAEISRSLEPEVLADAARQNIAAVQDTPSLLKEPAITSPPVQEKFRIPNSEFRIIGEAFQTYYLAQQGDDLLLIDKHAAHERILYEKLKAEHGQAKRQILLEPLPLQLNREEAAILLEHQDLLKEAGFVIEEFGAGTLVLRECPMLLTGTDLCGQMAEMAGYLLERRGDLATRALDWIFHSAACRAAVKAGDPSSQPERERFVEQLLHMPEVRTCPHGRPVMIAITKKELEKRFGRS